MKALLVAEEPKSDTAPCAAQQAKIRQTRERFRTFVPLGFGCARVKIAAGA